MQSKKEKAYAKINVYLDIQNKREDGFHNIFTLMQLVSLYDSVEVILDGSGAISVEMINSPIDIPTEKNINQVSCLGYDQPLSFERTEGGVKATLPCELAGSNPYAVAFALT